MRPQPLIAVTDVEASSQWYQRLLGCKSAHGGREYERLVVGDRLVMQLHSFEVDHHHGPIGNRSDKPYGNGVLLWFEVDDFDAVYARAQAMQAEMVMPNSAIRRMAVAAQTTGNAGCATRTATRW
jgi:Uncharacterized protein conserved in bacteria